MTANAVRLYRDERSGVRIVHFQAPGPLFSAHIVVPTPAPASNSGIPHCLEHLTFLGSHRYPQRGRLDTLATRCLSSGTNAWTADDHTTFSCINAGLDGLLATLPVLLDHVLFPTLTEENFLHEIFHLRENSSPSGVVFNEMLGRENSEADLLDQACRTLLFEGTDLVYDAGGRTDAIAKLTNSEVRDYHTEWYQRSASNISVIVGGGKNEHDVLDLVVEAVRPILAALDPRKLAGPETSTKRFTLAPLPEPVTSLSMAYPSAELEEGSVTFAWRGPKATDRDELCAVTVLLRYLAGTSAAPLFQEFVECPNPVGSDIERDVRVFPVSAIVLTFVGVPVLTGSGDADDITDNEMSDDGDHNEEDFDDEEESAEEEDDDDYSDCSEDDARRNGSENDEPPIDWLAKEILGQTMQDFFKTISKSGSGSDLPGGLEAFHRAVNKEEARFLESLENDPHEHVPNVLTTELLYRGSNDNGIDNAVDSQLNRIRSLKEKSLVWWRELLRQWLVHAPRVEVAMIPSSVRAKEIQMQNEKLIADIRADLGSDGLRTAVRRGKDAVLHVARSREEARQIEYPTLNHERVPRLPYMFSTKANNGIEEIEVKVESQFAQVALVYETRHLPVAERALLPILMDLVFSSPLRMPDGATIPYTTVVQQLSQSTVALDASATAGAATRELFSVYFCSRLEAFKRACDWVIKSLHFAELNPRRVKTITRNRLTAALEESRDGEAMNQATGIVLDEKLCGRRGSDTTNAMLFTPIHQRQVLRDALSCMENGDSVGLLSRLQSLRDKLVLTCPAMVQVGGPDARHLRAELREAGLLPNSTANPLRPAPSADKQPQVDGMNRLTRGLLTQVTGVDSTFVEVWIECLVSPTHPHYWALEVLCELLSVTEGPLYSGIRGQGLAYDASIVNRSSSGQLVFSVVESSTPAAAWEAFCKILEELGQDLMAPLASKSLSGDVETAKSGVLFELHEDRSNPSSIVYSIFRSSRSGFQCGTEIDHATEKKIGSVGVDDIATAFSLYLSKFLDASRRTAAVTCGLGPADNIQKGFSESKWPIHLQTISSIDDPFLALETAEV